MFNICKFYFIEYKQYKEKEKIFLLQNGILCTKNAKKKVTLKIFSDKCICYNTLKQKNIILILQTKKNVNICQDIINGLK